ncbi:MAG: hypothetical protein HZB56_11815 [Deltaproteobacteria bacterium]|nr:hypothetical protein [Deltaproteobacteria bacterium]
MAPPNQKPGQRSGPGAAGPLDPVDERHQTDQLNDQAARLEEEMEQLRARYEMYFLGVERREPKRDREEMKRRVERIKTAFTRNTGVKFRIQTLAARFLSYERMWTRSAREKEEGTYRRDLVRARRHAEERKQQETRAASAAPPPEAAAPAPGERPQLATPLPQLRAPEPLPPRAAPVPSGAVGEPQLRALYDAYIEAKKRCNEDVSRLSYDAVARSVQKQVPELLTRYRARSVEFKVVIQGGKALLKAVPKS